MTRTIRSNNNSNIKENTKIDEELKEKDININ